MTKRVLSVTILCALIILSAPAISFAAPSDLTMVGLSLDDASGNGNGLLERGEQGALTLSLRNEGSEVLTGVTAALSLDPIEVLEDEVTAPDIAPGATARFAFNILVPSDAVTEQIFFNDTGGGCTLAFGDRYEKSQPLPPQGATVSDVFMVPLAGTLRLDTAQGGANEKVNAAPVCVMGSRTTRAAPTEGVDVKEPGFPTGVVLGSAFAALLAAIAVIMIATRKRAVR